MVVDAFDSVLSAARAGADWAWERIYADLAGSGVGYPRAPGAGGPGGGAAARAGAARAGGRTAADLAGWVIGYLRAHGAADPEDVAGEAFLQVVRDLSRF